MPRARTNKLIFIENHNTLLKWPKTGATEIIGGVIYTKMRSFFVHWDLEIQRADIFDHFQSYMEHSCTVKTYKIYKTYKVCKISSKFFGL